MFSNVKKTPKPTFLFVWLVEMQRLKFCIEVWKPFNGLRCSWIHFKYISCKGIKWATGHNVVDSLDFTTVPILVYPSFSIYFLKWHESHSLPPGLVWFSRSTGGSRGFTSLQINYASPKKKSPISKSNFPKHSLQEGSTRYTLKLKGTFIWLCA